MSEKKEVTVRIKKEDWEKFKYIAGRKKLRAHTLVVKTIENHIDLFEKVYGDIETK